MEQLLKEKKKLLSDAFHFGQNSTAQVFLSEAEEEKKSHNVYHFFSN